MTFVSTGDAYTIGGMLTLGCEVRHDGWFPSTHTAASRVPGWDPTITVGFRAIEGHYDDAVPDRMVAPILPKRAMNGRRTLFISIGVGARTPTKSRQAKLLGGASDQ